MSECTEFDRKIEERLAAHQERQLAKGRLNVEAMHDLSGRIDQCSAVTRRVVDSVIRPRFVKLASRFANAEVSGEASGDHHCVCSFRRTEQYPAVATLEMGVTHDGAMQTLAVFYSLSVVPALVRFDGKDQLSIPLEQVDDARVVAWVEDKLVSFLDTYFQLESAEPYQAENVVACPVCGMRINKAHAVSLDEYRGQTYFFCVPDCQNKFAANPDQYVGAGHRT